MLIHASCDHGLDHSDVAKGGCPHQTTAGLRANQLQLYSGGGGISLPRVLPSELLSRDQERLVHARQAGELHVRQVVQHQDVCLRRQGNH